MVRMFASVTVAITTALLLLVGSTVGAESLVVDPRSKASNAGLSLLEMPLLEIAILNPAVRGWRVEKRSVQVSLASGRFRRSAQITKQRRFDVNHDGFKDHLVEIHLQRSRSLHPLTTGFAPDSIVVRHVYSTPGQSWYSHTVEQAASLANISCLDLVSSW